MTPIPFSRREAFRIWIQDIPYGAIDPHDRELAFQIMQYLGIQDPHAEDLLARAALKHRQPRGGKYVGDDDE